MPDSPANPPADPTATAPSAAAAPAPTAQVAPAPPAADDLAAKVQAEHAAVGEANQAIQDAVRSVDEIAAEAASVQAGPLPPMPAGTPPPEIERVPVAPELRRLLAIEVPVIVQLGTRNMSVGEVMRFSVGAIIEFQKSADEDLELLANNKPIGKGQAVKVGENFGIKITAVGPVKETIRKLGAA